MSDAPRAPFYSVTKLRLAILAGLVLAGAGAASWAFADRPKEALVPAGQSDVAGRPVQVRPAHFEAVSQPRILVGTLRARFESDRGFRVSGKIASRKVDVGSRVKAGDLLAQLDETDFRLSRESAEAELAAARSSARQANLERDRIAELRAKGWSTDQAFDRQKAALDEAEGRVKRAERQVELAQNAQSYAELRAEGDGTVIAVQAEAGQVVAAGQPIFRVARDGDREALVAIPEQDLALARDSTAEVALWSEPDSQHKAALRELSPNADSATRTFLARYTVEGLAPDAPLGMTVTLALTRNQSGKIARIPLSAILNEGSGAEVFVLDKASGTLGRKSVKVLSFDARDALVTDGLAEGDLVVTLGIHTLRSGQKARALVEAKL
jgi:RND family efflux transporter MFP subunit